MMKKIINGEEVDLHDRATLGAEFIDPSMSLRERIYYRPVEELQNDLFPAEELQEWRKEWRDMPEFEQQEMEPYASVFVRFSSEEDMQDFARLIGQPLTKGREAKSIWHPKLKAGNVHVQSGKRYADES